MARAGPGARGQGPADWARARARARTQARAHKRKRNIFPPNMPTTNMFMPSILSL